MNNSETQSSTVQVAFKHLRYSTDDKDRPIALIRGEVWQYEELRELQTEINQLLAIRAL